MGTKREHKVEQGRVLHELFKEVFALEAVLAAVMDIAHEMIGLSTPQHNIMNIIQQENAVPVPVIAARLGVSRQFVQTVCNKLLSCGFIEFVENPRHKRSRLVSLIRAGDALLKTAQDNENEMIGQAMIDIDFKEAQGATRLLASVRENLSLFSGIQDEWKG